MYFNFMTHKLIYNSFIQVDRIFLDKKLEMYPPLIFNLYELFLLKNVKLFYTPSSTPAPRRGRGVYCFTSVHRPVHPSIRPRYFSSHFSQ